MIAAADFGGTTIKLGLVQDGQITVRHRIAARAGRPMSERLEAVACGWEELLSEIGATRRDCAGVALALPFVVDADKARVLGEFGKFPGATQIDFAAWSRDRLDLELAMEGDARMALLGEWSAGAARGQSDAVMLALGTGIGCAAICGNRLLRGANNRAASIFGHSSIFLDGAVGRCGNIGCAEDLASTATLADRAREREDFAGSALSKAAKIDFESLFTLADWGDSCSRALRAECLRAWATLVQNAVIAYDPGIVVLGGGVLSAHEVILPAIREHLARHMPALPAQTSLATALLGSDAALIGGETLFHQTHPIPVS